MKSAERHRPERQVRRGHSRDHGGCRGGDYHRCHHRLVPRVAQPEGRRPGLCCHQGDGSDDRHAVKRTRKPASRGTSSRTAIDCLPRQAALRHVRRQRGLQATVARGILAWSRASAVCGYQEDVPAPAGSVHGAEYPAMSHFLASRKWGWLVSGDGLPQRKERRPAGRLAGNHMHRARRSWLREFINVIERQ